ncbi:Protein SOSEKI 1 [Rhinocladiella similis]
MKSTMCTELDIPPKGDSQSEKNVGYAHGSASLLDGPSCHSEASEAGEQASNTDPYLQVLDGRRSHEDNTREQISIPACVAEDEVEALLHATHLPPVTRESLEELDLMYIQSNINLRVDINYDHDLHFTPVSGCKGEQKREEAKKYWLSLEAELRIVYQHNQLVSCSRCQEARRFAPMKGQYFKPRLRQMFLTLKELLSILVPDRDQDQIVQYLDITLLLQEVSHGLLDVVRLARWLCVLLTTHCAPMRDESAQEMADQVRQGAEKGDLHALVAGIEKLFSFLEAMKLDVANHQIRSFRYHLIDDTVPFQQEYFRLRILSERIDAGPSRQWYLSAAQEHKLCSTAPLTHRTFALEPLVHGMAKICVSSNPVIPETLKHDRSRLRTIREEIQDFLHLEMSLKVFDELVCYLRDASSKDPLTRRRLQNRAVETRARLYSRLMDLTEGYVDPGTSISDMWYQHASAIGLELAHAAGHACGWTMQISEADVAKATTQLRDMFNSEQRDHVRAITIGCKLEKSALEYAAEFQGMTTLSISEAQKQWQQMQQQKSQGRIPFQMDTMARMLAHMAVVNFRVWTELVYLEHEGDTFQEEFDSISATENS